MLCFATFDIVPFVIRIKKNEKLALFDIKNGVYDIISHNLSS